MRATGKTFRMLINAIGMVSGMPEDKNGVVVYAYSERYGKDLFDKAIAILATYSSLDGFKIIKRDLTIRFPNNKILQFRSMREPRERQCGVDWTLYDEFSDHHIPDDIFDYYTRNKKERDIRRTRSKTIYFKLLGMMSIEVIRGTILSEHNEYCFVKVDGRRSPIVVHNKELSTKKQYDLWQTLHGKQKQIEVIKQEIVGIELEIRND